MPTRLSLYARQRIVFLNTEGKSLGEIVRILREEGYITTKTTVRRWIHRHKTHQGLEDGERSGRPSNITEEIALCLNENLKRDDELSSRELSYIVSKTFGVVISPPAIRAFLRQKLKWTVVRTRFGPMISTANKVKRKDFALKCLAENDQFEDVIWTDESFIHLRRHAELFHFSNG